MKKKEIRSRAIETRDSIDRILDRLGFIENSASGSDCIENEIKFSGYELSSTIRAIAGDLKSINEGLKVIS